MAKEPSDLPGSMTMIYAYLFSGLAYLAII